MTPSDAPDGRAMRLAAAVRDRAAKPGVFGLATAGYPRQGRRLAVPVAALAGSMLVVVDALRIEAVAPQDFWLDRVAPGPLASSTARALAGAGAADRTHNADYPRGRKPQAIRRVVAPASPMRPMARCVQRRPAVTLPSRGAGVRGLT